MSLTLVDGYNLLHASGVFGATRGARGLESSRTALLDHVADLVGETAPRVLCAQCHRSTGTLRPPALGP